MIRLSVVGYVEEGVNAVRYLKETYGNMGFKVVNVRRLDDGFIEIEHDVFVPTTGLLNAEKDWHVALKVNEVTNADEWEVLGHYPYHKNN